MIEIQKDLDKLEHWVLSNKMFNFGKHRVMFLERKINCTGTR